MTPYRIDATAAMQICDAIPRVIDAKVQELFRKSLLTDADDPRFVQGMLTVAKYFHQMLIDAEGAESPTVQVLTCATVELAHHYLQVVDTASGS